MCPQKKLARKTIRAVRSDDFKVYKTGWPEVQARDTTRGRELNTLRKVNLLGAQEKLINAMMDPDPSKRPTMQAVAEHAYFNDARLFDPVLQQLTAAIIDGKDEERIRELGKQAKSNDRI